MWKKFKNPQKNPEKGRFDPVTGVFGRSRENSQSHQKHLYGVKCKKITIFDVRRQILKIDEKFKKTTKMAKNFKKWLKWLKMFRI